MKKVPLPEQILVKQVVQVFGMVAHCYHSKTSWRCFLNLKRKENKAYGCDKKIKKKELKLKKIILRKTNWAKILKIIINELFEQKNE